MEDYVRGENVQLRAVPRHSQWVEAKIADLKEGGVQGNRYLLAYLDNLDEMEAIRDGAAAAAAEELLAEESGTTEAQRARRRRKKKRRKKKKRRGESEQRLATSILAAHQRYGTAIRRGPGRWGRVGAPSRPILRRIKSLGDIPLSEEEHQQAWATDGGYRRTRKRRTRRTRRTRKRRRKRRRTRRRY